MEVSVYNTQSALGIQTKSVEALVKEVLLFENVSTDEIAIHFVDLPCISNLHLKYFDDPSPTDCISFPLDPPSNESEEYSVLGEVFICPQVALDYALENTEDPYKEVSLYIVHGILHLLGYDDIDEDDCEEMRSAELRHMENLCAKGVILEAFCQHS